MALASIYCNALKHHFKVFHANWLPGTPLKLGDYGQVIGGTFRRIGNIQDEGIAEIEIRTDQTEDQYEFVSSAETEFIFQVGGGGSGNTLGSVRAGLEIKFGSANSIFFNAAGCTLDSIENVRQVGDALIDADKRGNWKRPWSVVTSLVRSGATTIVVSGSKDSSIKLEAAVEGVKEIDLADASLKLVMRNQRNVAFKLIAKDGLMPMMALMQVQRGGMFDSGVREFVQAVRFMQPEPDQTTGDTVFGTTQEEVYVLPKLSSVD